MHFQVIKERLIDGRTYKPGELFDASKLAPHKILGLQRTRVLGAHAVPAPAQAQPAPKGR